MRIGGVLEFGREGHTFSRTKQRNNSLLNAMGQPVSEVAILAHLAGLSREAYGTMFSLDDETLEAGGKSILESRGAWASSCSRPAPVLGMRVTH